MTLSQGTDAVVTFLVSGRARPVSPTWLQSPALARAQRADGAGEGRLAAGLVAVILILRDVGFSLAEQKAFLASRATAPRGWQRLARRKLAELDDQIAKAQTAREAIDHALRCPHDDILDCPTFATIIAARLTGQPLSEASSTSHDGHHSPSSLWVRWASAPTGMNPAARNARTLAAFAGAICAQSGVPGGSIWRAVHRVFHP